MTNGTWQTTGGGGGGLLAGLVVVAVVVAALAHQVAHAVADVVSTVLVVVAASAGAVVVAGIVAGCVIVARRGRAGALSVPPPAARRSRAATGAPAALSAGRPARELPPAQHFHVHLHGDVPAERAAETVAAIRNHLED